MAERAFAMLAEPNADLTRLGLAGLAGRPPRVSFEVFPPKTPQAASELWATLARLEPLSPRFVSVTYGALGSTRDETRGALQRLLVQTRLKPAAHLTCYGGSREQVDDIIRDYWELGVRHMVALRGDLPNDADAACLAGGYRNATELTRAITRIAPFEVSVAAYPEKHPESASLLQDVDVLKAKVDAGATRAITQFFFDLEAFYRFVDLVRKAGISIPIIPGIMPIANFNGIKRMAERCQVKLPLGLHRLFDGLDDQPQTRAMIATAVAAEMCAELNARGFSELHIYTLNKADLVYATCRMLGLEDRNLKAAA
jgi:methylenetetrahydrofolate reductase (NADPH)